jgi:hypothetical protein
LFVGEPLHVLEVVDGIGQTLACLFERGGLAIAQLRLPLPPVAGAMLVVQRPEQGIVLQPPGLTLPEITEGPGSIRAGCEMPTAEGHE